MDINRICDILTRHEGVRLKIYDDATGQPIGPGDTLVGHPTIGVGRCLDTNGVSLDESRFLLVNDIRRCLDSLQTRFSWFKDLTVARQEIIVCMVFNLGINGFAGFKNMIAAIEDNRWQDAAKEMLESTWAKQVGNRAVELSQAMELGRF